MRTPSIPMIGFLQAAGIVAYVTLLIAAAGTVGPYLDVEFPFAPFLFLLLFCFSALLCASIALGYPVMLAHQGKLKQAARIICWMIFWLGTLIFVLTVLTAIFFRGMGI
ncbi:hypothetical protein HYZ99_05200 [Candidatus Peregrinibacteria bacterium]|nr:hypothetical protein [Candidatus Peregrinibacteria bacterium]